MTRRRFLTLTAAATGLAALPGATAARAAPAYGIPATEFGLLPDTEADQTAALQRAIDETSRTGRAVFVPPGHYATSRLSARSGTRLVGIAGKSRLVGRGGGALFNGEGAEQVSLSGLVLDGAGRSLGNASGILEMRAVPRLEIVDCDIVNSAGNGLQLTECGGRIARSRLHAIAHTALHSLDGKQLDVVDNHIADCGDNGIRIWQSQARHDGSRVDGNRIGTVAAASGGTGQNGNAINVFRAGDVMVSNNRIADCAFSAIRNNSGGNIMIYNNHCRNLGEVAIYSEFAFEGAVIAQNLVDGAALGISVVNFDSGGRLAAVTGNLIRNIEIGGYPEERGIGIAVEADAALNGNVVENCAFAALKLGHGPYLRDVAAVGNVLREAMLGIAVSVAPGAGTALIADNVISGMARGGIVGMAWDDIIAEDLTQRGLESYPQLAIQGNRID